VKQRKLTERPAGGPPRAQEAPRAEVPVLGIVGGLASGKSTVARLLSALGARIVDADRIGHETLERPQVKEALTESFGEAILDDAGKVSHERLAQAAFGRPELVEKLNGIVHPSIIAEIRSQVNALEREPGVPLIVLDAALLMETGLDKELCQALVFVDTPRPSRQERAGARRGMSAEQFGKREQAQLQEETRRRAADFVVSNNGSLKELENQVERLWPELRRIAAQRSVRR